MAEHLFNAAPVILIVDDQPSDVLMLSEAVRDLGEVHVASDGRMALEVARFCRPDLVLLDIQMPQMNGFEICRAMKADPSCAMPPSCSSPRTRRARTKSRRSNTAVWTSSRSR